MSIDKKDIQDGLDYWMVSDDRPKKVRFIGFYKSIEALLISGREGAPPSYYEHLALFLTEKDCLRYIIVGATQQIKRCLDIIDHSNSRLSEL